MSVDTHWFLRARLKMRQLLLLEALGEEGNIHRASQVLNMTQPAASKLLKDLEDVLGLALFERLPRGMEPTKPGETMIRHARMALTNLNHAYDEIEGFKAGRFGHVNVGAITTPGVRLLPAALALVKAKFPSLRASVQIETSDVLIERLAQGKLDMFVGRLFERHDKTALLYEPIAEEPICALVRPGHPLLSYPQLGLRDLASFGWIVPPSGSILRHRWELMFQQEGVSVPQDVIESAAVIFVFRMLRQSDLITVLSCEVAQDYLDHGMAQGLPIELPCKMDAYGIITRADRLQSPAAEVVLDAIRGVAKSVYGTPKAPAPLS